MNSKRMTEEEGIYNNIEEVLPRYCEGLATEVEICLVEEWIGKDESHRKIVNHIHMLNLAADTLHIMQSIDTERALKKVKSRTKKKEITWWEWTQRIAALLFIPLLIGALMLYFNHNKPLEVAQMIEIKTNPGMTTSVVLPDSTVVYLNSESTLRYPSNFGKDIREVKLTGEAYFDVTKDRDRLFVISTPHQAQIEVYGTSFNVEAYDNDRISTTLVEGQVGFLFKDKAGASVKIDLEPHQKLVYKPTSGETQVSKTSCESEIAWKEGKIVFYDTSMDEILLTLSKRFNVEFVVKNKHLEEYSFTGTFTTQRLEHIMEYFKRSSRINWRYLDSDDITDKKQRIEIY